MLMMKSRKLSSCTVTTTVISSLSRIMLICRMQHKMSWRDLITKMSFFFSKQKTAYEILALLEFRRVLFRSLPGLETVAENLCRAPELQLGVDASLPRLRDQGE